MTHRNQKKIKDLCLEILMRVSLLNQDINAYCYESNQNRQYRQNHCHCTNHQIWFQAWAFFRYVDWNSKKGFKEQQFWGSPFVNFLKVKSYQTRRLHIVWRTVGSKGECFRLQGRNFPRGWPLFTGQKQVRLFVIDHVEANLMTFGIVWYGHIQHILVLNKKINIFTDLSRPL